MPRPDGASRTFVCPQCDFVLDDEVIYVSCPVCQLPVDWVDMERPLWCCATCDAIVNDWRDEWPRCERCDALMDRVHALETAPASNATGPSVVRRIGIGLYTLTMIAQIVVMALDPLGFVFVAPFLILALVAAVAMLVSFVASLGELRALVGDRATCVVHGLEHATVNILLADGAPALGGETHAGGFVIELRNDGTVRPDAVERAAHDAIRRVHTGERALAYSPRCGTSVLVALLLLAIIVVGGSVLGFVLGASAGAIAAAVVAVALLTWPAARPLGLLAQRTLTVSTTFASATVTRVVHAVDPEGDRVRFAVLIAVDRAA